MARFLFTYSVADKSSQNEASKAREVMRNLDLSNWRKLDNVETTFTGTISISRMNDKDEMKEYITNDIESKVKLAFSENGIDLNKFHMHFAVLVDGLNECIEFSI